MSKVQTQRAVEDARLSDTSEDEADEEQPAFKEESPGEQQPLSPGVLLVKVGAGVPSSPSGLSVDEENTEMVQIKEEPEEQSIKHEEEEQPVSVPGSSAVCSKRTLLLQRQSEHRKGTQGQGVNSNSERETRPSLITNNKQSWGRPFSCLSSQKAVGDHYSPLQVKDTVAQTSGPSLDYKKPYSCSVCKKTFAKKGQLDVHTRTHTGEKPYSCYFCEKLFAKKSNLDLHVRLHTGEKPYSCQYCEKTFAQISNLKVHMRTHTGEKPYSCSECEKTFAQKNTLKAHMKTHITDKLHSCSICAKAFLHKTNLDVHMRIHTGVKPYSCDFCEKTFTQNSNLKAHLRIHTGEKPYSCSMCEKTFAQKGTLDGHVKLHLQRENSRCVTGGD